MNIDQFNKCTETLFGDLLQQFKDQGEYGINHWNEKSVGRIGYSTNLTPEIIEQAKEKNVELILTHHDAWDFVYGMKVECIKKLKQYHNGHYYIHSPLDYVEFGTCHSLLNEIGEHTIVQQ